ncbi:MAG: putative bifunctional diguanylate cyclase/phosphodiesterase [Acidimicrobiales bacterium]
MAAAVVRPGERLLRRFSSATKFLIVAAVLASPLVWLAQAYASDKLDQIRFSDRERVGLRAQEDLVGVLFAVLDPGRDLDAALRGVDPVDLRALDLQHDWSGLERRLRAQEAERSTLARELSHLIVTVGDRSNLTLDPEVKTYYLMDALQFRLPSIAIFGADALDRARDDTSGVYGVVAAERHRLSESLGRAEAALRADHDSRRAVVAEVAAQSADLAVEPVAEPPIEPSDARAAHVRAVEAQWRTLAPLLDRLLVERIDGLPTERSAAIWVAVLCIVLAAYLFASLATSVLHPVQRILDALKAAGRGDLSGSVLHLEGSDELAAIERQVGETLAQVRDTQALLSHQATHDALTGLPNRRLATWRIGEAIGRTRRNDGDLAAVLFIDLDRFKVINDSLGHEVGDRVLRAVVERLRTSLRAIDVIARLAGDEFVVICEHLKDRSHAVDLAERIVLSLKEPLLIDTSHGTVDLVVGASVGVAAVKPGDETDAASLLRDADVAMYTAKQQRRGSVVLFDAGQREDAQRLLEVREALRRAIDRDQIEVHLQPIVPLSRPGRLCFEALARWNREESGPITPGEFIPIAEDSGLIVPLGLAVLHKSCTWLASQQAAGHQVEIAVNLSPRQLGHPTLIHDVARVIAETGVDPDGLWLEITETALADETSHVTEVLHRLRELGVHLSIDDFGTGYSSLGHLSHFPVEQLKVDRSFVAGMLDGGRAGNIVAAITRLAHGLGLSVVAEGVEQEAQAERLRVLGCDDAQGWLFGRPQPPEYYQEMVERAPSGTRTHT